MATLRAGHLLNPALALQQIQHSLQRVRRNPQAGFHLRERGDVPLAQIGLQKLEDHKAWAEASFSAPCPGSLPAGPAAFSPRIVTAMAIATARIHARDWRGWLANVPAW